MLTGAVLQAAQHNVTCSICLCGYASENSVVRICAAGFQNRAIEQQAIRETNMSVLLISGRPSERSLSVALPMTSDRSDFLFRRRLQQVLATTVAAWSSDARAQSGGNDDSEGRRVNPP